MSIPQIIIENITGSIETKQKALGQKGNTPLAISTVEIPTMS